MWKQSKLIKWIMSLDATIINGESVACDDAGQDTLEPRLLTGEIEVARAKNVFLLKSISKKKAINDNYKAGLLIVTNFKLSFIPHQNSNKEIIDAPYQENAFLGNYDVTLSNIDCVYQISEKKKKYVGPESKTNSKIDILQIVCKNFRVLKFGFRNSEVGKGKLIAEALAKFAFPNRHNLSFIYNFTDNYYNTLRNVCMFNKKSDWSQEIARCGATGWKVLTVESQYDIPEGSLPNHYVVPKSLTDADYFSLARYFRQSRTAIWVWGLENAALVRMADLLPDISDTRHENAMMEHIRKCHPQKKPPFIMELTKFLPSNQDVYLSYKKLRDLCTPDTTDKFLAQDTKFYAFLDKTCWLLYVSLCIKLSNEAADRMKTGETVVLQENDGRDMCCLISSLVQLILDPQSRTISGYQTLIQKEWVSLGHPFSDRIGHIVHSSLMEQSPIFLLFLDCTWQLLQQSPEEFEFSETFLTTIWDSVFLPLFDTFQFNSEHDRYTAKVKEHLKLRPVWDWAEQFHDKDIILFSNPLYKRPPEHYRKSMPPILPPNAVPLPIIGATNYQGTSRMSMLSPHQVHHSQQQQQQNHLQDYFLSVKHEIRDLDIWRQCYYRWMPLVEIINGGPPQIELFNRVILSNISRLQQALQTNDFNDLPQIKTYNNDNNDDVNDYVLLRRNQMPMINSFFPFSRNVDNTNELTDILMYSNEMLTEGSIFDGLSLAQAPD